MATHSAGRKLWTPTDQNNLRRSAAGKSGSYLHSPYSDEIVKKVYEAEEANDELGIKTSWTQEFERRQKIARAGQAVQVGMPVEITDDQGNPLLTIEDASPEAKDVIEQGIQVAHPTIEKPSVRMPRPGTPEFMERVQPAEKFITEFQMDLPPDIDDWSKPERDAMHAEAMSGARVRILDDASGEPVSGEIALNDVIDDASSQRVGETGPGSQ